MFRNSFDVVLGQASHLSKICVHCRHRRRLWRRRAHRSKLPFGVNRSRSIRTRDK